VIDVPPPWSHHRPAIVSVVACAAIGLTACQSGVPPTALGAKAPAIPTPLSTSVQTSAGIWATVPMGHLGQPLNTFWQLFFRPTGSASWSNRVEATATATNGGLVLARSDRDALVVGIRPSNDLTFTPLITTSDGGSSWSNGLLSSGLASRPDALAAGPAGEVLALVNDRGAEQVLSSSGSLSSWRLLTTESALAHGAAGTSCGLGSLTSLGHLGARPLVGGSCARPSVVGLFVEGSGGWHLVGPTISASLAGGRLEVLGLHATDAGVAALLGAVDRSGVRLAAAWTGGTGSWTISSALRVARTEQVASFGTTTGTGLYVLLAGPAGTRRLDVVSDASPSWKQLPPPPADTATVAFGTGSIIAALTVRDAVMTVWGLGSPSGDWIRSQVIRVSILYGSSG